jgi:beta-N-acetylhexosaminidase
VPLLIASDLENGAGMRMAGIYSFPHLLPQGGATNFPPVMALGAAGSDSLAYALGRVLATEARAVGVHMTFGPVVDVNSNPANPIINTRSFGEDPGKVGRLAAAYVRGAREGGLLTTAKHFPGHGDTEVDSHMDLPAIRADRARLDSVELAPYRTIIRDVDGVMTAHIAVVGVEGSAAPPATLSPRFLTDVLRGELGFNGVVFTDAMDMGAIVRRYGTTEPAVRAVEAGADVILMPIDVPGAIQALVSAVETGRVPVARIDASVRRILEAKLHAGLSQERMVDQDAVSRLVGVRAHTELARRIAERSITLARDDHGWVPISASARSALIVTYAEADWASGAGPRRCAHHACRVRRASAAGRFRGRRPGRGARDAARRYGLDRRPWRHHGFRRSTDAGPAAARADLVRQSVPGRGFSRRGCLSAGLGWRGRQPGGRRSGAPWRDPHFRPTAGLDSAPLQTRHRDRSRSNA